MRRRTDRFGGGYNGVRRPGLDAMRGRLLAGLVVLALVPALVGVLFASVLVRPTDHTVPADLARRTSSAASVLLVRAQAIETRLAALAADADVARLAGNATGSTSTIRQLARRTMSSLRGADGSIVAGACVVRVGDARQTVIAEDHRLVDPMDSCAGGEFLREVDGLAAGTVARYRPDDSGHLLIATPISSRGTSLALSAAIDLETLLRRTATSSRTAPTSVVVDRGSGDLVAGTTRTDIDPTAAAAIAPASLAIYADGILSDHRETRDALSRSGWATTVAELWPTTTGAGLGLIQAWPQTGSSPVAELWFALCSAAIVALVGVLVLMRSLLQPFRELRESQEHLESKYHEARQDSLHDGLTGLGNHRAYQEELQRQLKLAERHGTPFSLMLVDLDNLKVVNDREGHAEGDRLLLGLAASMRDALRIDDRIFRIGGDEFAVLMPGTEADQASQAAARLRLYCQRPPSGGPPTPFSGGISSAPRFALEGAQLQRQADLALYWAKEHGRGFVEVFDPERDGLTGDDEAKGLDNEVYEIARDRRFTPVFQPIVDLRTGAVLGFEGLVRPDPTDLIPDAEALFVAAAATGRTVELDLASFETVVEAASAIGSDHVISINLSAKTLEVSDFDSSWLLDALVRHGIDPTRVIVELTERDPIDDVTRLRANVRSLRDCGLRMAADDVGAGSAGLRLLAEVPFDVVKIDLSLVQSGDQQEASWAVLRSIRDLAWRQRSVVIGEHVETAEQLRVLQELQIPFGQGYLLGHPEAEADKQARDLVRLALDRREATVSPSSAGGEVRGLPRLPELSPGRPGSGTADRPHPAT